MVYKGQLWGSWRNGGASPGAAVHGVDPEAVKGGQIVSAAQPKLYDQRHEHFHTNHFVHRHRWACAFSRAGLGPGPGHTAVAFVWPHGQWRLSVARKPGGISQCLSCQRAGAVGCWIGGGIGEGAGKLVVVQF